MKDECVHTIAHACILHEFACMPIHSKDAVPSGFSRWMFSNGFY
jgi:hypothetical protein